MFGNNIDHNNVRNVLHPPVTCQHNSRMRAVYFILVKIWKQDEIAKLWIDGFKF